MKAKSHKISTLILHTGYVESASNACLLMTNVNGFNSVQEALMSIRAALIVASDEDKENAWISKCCKEAKSSTKINFCPECGTPTKDVSVSVAEQFEAYFTGIADGSHDTLEALQSEGWEFDHKLADLKNAVIVDSTKSLLETCDTWSYERWIQDGEDAQSEEHYVHIHVQFMSEAMEEMLFKRG